MEVTKQSGCILSYDPNLRLPLWPSGEAARQGIMSLWNQADVIKVCISEFKFRTNEDITMLFHISFNLPINFVFTIDLMVELQVSKEELMFLTGSDGNEALEKLYHPNLKLLIVTEGSEGCRYYTKVSISILLFYLSSHIL